MENSEGEPAWGWQWNCGLCLHTSLFLFVIFFFSKSFWEPGANNKLLSCAISETWLTCRWTRCHFRCVSFMFLVSLSTLIPFFFFFFLKRVGVDTAEDTQAPPPPPPGWPLVGDGEFPPSIPFRAHWIPTIFGSCLSVVSPSAGGCHSHPEKLLVQPRSFLTMGSLRSGVKGLVGVREREKGDV